MSILQEYEEIKKEIGERKFNMIGDYIDEICPKEKMDKYKKELAKINKLDFYDWLDHKKELEKKYGVIFLSDVIYKKQEWEKFEKWYKEKNKDKEVEILNIWRLEDYDEIRCNAIIKINGKEVANIIDSYDEREVKYAFEDNNDEMIGNYKNTALKDLILSRVDDYLKLPKISECSRLLQEIYDNVCSSEASMCHITDEDWKEFYSDEYTDKDFEILKLEVKRFGLENVMGINDGEYKIIGYGNLEIMFNDDRNLKKEKEMGIS